MNVYLVTLEGGGDRYIKVVDQETYDWITSDDMGRPEGEDNSSSWEDQLVPASQIAKMKKQRGEDYEPVSITSGSWDNDRAIAALSADGYDDDYDSIKEALRDIKKKGDEMEDEYHGCMY